MDEKNREMKKRPRAQAANRGAPQQRRTPPRTKENAQTAADNEQYEVYVPDAQSQRTRHAEAAEQVPSERSRREPAKRKRTPAGRDAQYHPYRQANQLTKARKKQSFRQRVSDFFSYKNPVVKLFYKEDPSVFGDDARTARQAKRAAEEEKRRKRAQQLNTPAAIYTQPVPFNTRRLAIQLITVLSVVLALVLGMSVFFKVKHVGIVGANVYDEYTILQESGIKEGDNLLTFGRTKASGKIIANLPYIKSARIAIKLPDTVIIEVEEAAVVYSIQDQDGVWWLINSDGKVVEQTSSQVADTYTQVLGVALYQPQVGEVGVAEEEAPTETDASGETIQALITGAQRLNAALKILQALELNDIVGDAASVNVSQLQDITLWYGTQYQVNLGSIDRIDYKIAYMKNVILQMSDYQTGILDVSFTTWPDQAGYTPFN